MVFMDNLQTNNYETWIEKYEYAKRYYTKNGDLLIPATYETDDGVKLGAWISHQRRDFSDNRLSKDKIELLEKIGMIWSVFDAQWDEYYEYAKKYFSENGNLFVPVNYTTNNGIKLGHWIGKQRKQYKDGRLSLARIDLLDRIGMVWSVYDIQWFANYELSIEYYKKNGNLLVPLRYVTENNMHLGAWIAAQRKNYKSGKLSKDRMKLLNKIGMVWDGISETWNEMYRTAKQYYEEYKNLSIASTSFNYKSKSLGSWIVTQRKNYFQNRLSDIQIDLLNDIGMEWIYTNNPDYVWDKNYETVLEFYSRYKHLYIPINYVTEEGVHIGTWLYDRKLEYERNELSDERKRKLDMLDKTWLESINTKSSFPEQAVLFYIKKAFPSAAKLSTKEISEIDIYISELNTGIEYDGPSHKNRVIDDINKTLKCRKMGIELIRIRDSSLPVIADDTYKIILQTDTLDALDKGIIELLHHLKVRNIDVNTKRDYIEIADGYIKSIDIDWYKMYDKLIEYYNANGNINVPVYYKSLDGTKLGRWLSNLRNSYKSPEIGNIRLNSNKIRLLEDLGIDWSPIETQWENMYSLAKQYYDKKGDLLIPDLYITNDGTKLGRWISTQRYNYKRGILSIDKIRLLEKIGMIWSVADYEWMKMYRFAELYYKKNGDLMIPYTYKVKGNIMLGAWIGLQRKRYRNHKISNERIELLNTIGMIWNPKEKKT